MRLLPITASLLPHVAMHRHYAATPITFRITAPAGYEEDTLSALTVEILEDRLRTSDPIAAVSLDTPTGPGPWDIVFPGDSMDLPLLGNPELEYWIRISVLPAGSANVIWHTARLTLIDSGSANSAAAPPDVTTLLTEASADLLYAPLAAPPLALQDSTLPLYIIPVMRHFGAEGSEALGLWYSHDLLTFEELYPGDLYTGTPSDNVRDPSLLIRPDGWYIAYTAGTFGHVTYFGLAKSTDQGRTWAFHGNITCAGSVDVTWGPSFFTDPVSGQLYLFISFSTGGGNHKAHVMRCLSTDLLTWEAPVLLTGDPSAETYSVDIRVAYAAGYYYQIASVGSKNPGSPAISGPAIYRSRSLVGPWTTICSPYAQWHTGGNVALEQTFLTHLGADRWQVNFTKVTGGAAGGVWVSYSADNLLTWSTPVQVTSNPDTPHNFSEYVLIRPDTGPADASNPRFLTLTSTAAARVATDLPVGKAGVFLNAATGIATLDLNVAGTLRSIRIGAYPVTYPAPAGVGVNLTTNIDFTPLSMGWPYANGAPAVAYKVIVSAAQPSFFYQEFLVRGGAAASTVFDSAQHGALTLISGEANDYFDAALSVPGSTGPLRVAITNKIKDGNAWTINIQIILDAP